MSDMSITGIENKYIRRVTLVVMIPILATVGVLAYGLYKFGETVIETWLELPSAFGNAWHGRD